MIRAVAPPSWARLVMLLLLLASSGCGWVDFGAHGGSRRPSTTTARVPLPLPRPSDEPVGTSSETPDPRYRTITVARGDTIEALSLRHGVPVYALVDANHLAPPFELQPGQRLILPGAPEHRVRDGETLYSIAQRYGVDVYALAAYNGLTQPYIVRPGQRLRLPLPGTRMAKRPAEDTQTREEVEASTVIARLPTPIEALPKPPQKTGRGFVWPVEGKVISTYGSKDNGLYNDGINIAAEPGTSVRAVENGVVAYAGNELRAFGNLLLIEHEGGWVSAYAHNEVLLVGRGDKVEKGQPVARVGRSGSVTVPQLHFELRKNKRAVDPLKHLQPHKT